ncbi:MAG: polyprenyl diphosphate synthase [Candidatus Sericytochromatia bacterium]|nr:polyprenyl diphosphate synthase [Candidatus Sericytochromatia bacterium]
MNDPWGKLDRARLPRHVAIIMDGNRRWAKQRLLPGGAGHEAGRRALKRIVQSFRNLGIPYLTVYAFSTENWSRSQEEVGFLWSLFRETLRGELRELDAAGVRMRFPGERDALPPDVRRMIEEAEARTTGHRGLTLNIALNYGSRSEILRAVRRVAEEVAAGQLVPTALDEQTFAACLDTAGQPDPDLLIRTSGEGRLSNFLLWQLAYAELHITPVLWPDFDDAALVAALLDFQGRHRRFGGGT